LQLRCSVKDRSPSRGKPVRVLTPGNSNARDSALVVWVAVRHMVIRAENKPDGAILRVELPLAQSGAK
jgi:hypothetical protein